MTIVNSISLLASFCKGFTKNVKYFIGKGFEMALLIYT